MDSAIGKRLRRGDGSATCGDAEDAAAIGDELAVLQRGSGMKYLDSLQAARLFQPPNLAAPLDWAGIPPGGHHHAERGLIPPAHRDLVERCIGCGEHDRDTMVLEPHHEYLAFRITEAHIVLDDLRSFARDHQSRIKNSRIGS